MAKMMRVSVTLALDVDRETWAATYGTGEDAAGVRADVREYVANAVRGTAAVDEFAITSVEMKA